MVKNHSAGSLDSVKFDSSTVTTEAIAKLDLVSSQFDRDSKPHKSAIAAITQDLVKHGMLPEMPYEWLEKNFDALDRNKDGAIGSKHGKAKSAGKDDLESFIETAEGNDKLMALIVQSQFEEMRKAHKNKAGGVFGAFTHERKAITREDVENKLNEISIVRSLVSTTNGDRETSNFELLDKRPNGKNDDKISKKDFDWYLNQISPRQQPNSVTTNFDNDTRRAVEQLAFVAPDAVRKRLTQTGDDTLFGGPPPPYTTPKTLAKAIGVQEEEVFQIYKRLV